MCLEYIITKVISTSTNTEDPHNLKLLVLFHPQQQSLVQDYFFNQLHLHLKAQENLQTCPCTNLYDIAITISHKPSHYGCKF